MNNISQKTVFDYIEIEILGDLTQLKLCLENFGEDCALDGKLLDSYAKNNNKKSTSDEEKKTIVEKMMPLMITNMEKIRNSKCI